MSYTSSLNTLSLRRANLPKTVKLSFITIIKEKSQH